MTEMTETTDSQDEAERAEQRRWEREMLDELDWRENAAWRKRRNSTWVNVFGVLALLTGNFIVGGVLLIVGLVMRSNANTELHRVNGERWDVAPNYPYSRSSHDKPLSFGQALIRTAIFIAISLLGLMALKDDGDLPADTFNRPASGVDLPRPRP